MSAGNRWYWLPDAANTQPAYAPALVAFLPATGANEIGWVPLAPGDPYAPAYYDANWQPHYYDGNSYAPERVVNMGVPGGLTVVSVDDFDRRIDRNSIVRYDPRSFEGMRPVLEPFSNALLRQASLKHAHANERRGFVLPPGLAKKLDSTRVYASAPPPRFRDDLARRFRVEPVPDKQKREKLKFDDKRQEAVQAPPPARGFEQARGRGRNDRREEKAEKHAARGRDSWTRPVNPEAERVAAARAEAHARGEREAQATANERQRASEHQRQRFEAQRQAEANAHAQRQAAQQQRAQQAAAQRAQQQEMMNARQAQQQQRRAERQQQRPAAQAPPGHARHEQAPAGGPPAGGGGGKGQGQGHGGGGGKGKGKHETTVVNA